MRTRKTVSPEPPEQFVQWLPGRESRSRFQRRLCQVPFHVDEHETHRLGEASGERIGKSIGEGLPRGTSVGKLPAIR
jgi:hypothetical protein